MKCLLNAPGKWLVPGLAVLLPAGPGFAQEGEIDALDEIVVTATRIESTIRDAARSVSVVTKDRIQNGTQQLALDEALSGIPGLYMQNRYNFAQDLRISLRGFGARSSFGIRGVRVFVDGIPETLPDGQAQLDSIDLGSASRIEVLRGPASSLFGNASGGVISVESELGDSPPFLQGTVAAGDYAFQKYQLKAGGRSDSVDYMISGSRQELDGYREHSKARGTVINGKLGFHLSQRDELIISANHTDQPEAQDPGGINAAQAASDPSSARDRNILFDAGEALNQQRIGAIYRVDRAGGDLMLRNYYVWRDFSNKLPFVSGGSVDLQRFFAGFGAQYSRDDLWSERLTLTGGVDIDRQDDDRRRFDNNAGVLGDLVFDQQEQVSSNGVYLQGQYAFDDAWTLLAGLRYDQVTFDVTDRYLANGDESGKLDFDQVSPSLALNYKFGSNILFGSLSRSFETPTTTELANPDGSGGFNETLVPQTANSFEIGYKGATAELSYEVSVFRIELEDELIPFELANQPGRTFYSNAGSSTRNGLETALSWKSDSGFGVDLSYTWSDFVFDQFVDDNGNDFAGKRLPGLPEHFGYLGLTYRSEPGLSATYETIYSGNLYADNNNAVNVDSYVVANFRISYEFTNGNWLVRPYVGINNLFDEGYNSNIRINAFGGRYFEPAPPRNYYAGVVVNFQKSG